MLQTTKGKILLAEKRELFETGWYRNLRTVVSPTDQCTGQGLDDCFYFVHDETLAGGRDWIHKLTEDSALLLLPVVGGILVLNENGEETYVEAGQILTLQRKAGEQLVFQNPYEDALVNYIVFGFRKVGEWFMGGGTISFDMERVKNQLLTLWEPPSKQDSLIRLSIGCFDGRKESVYHTVQEDNCCYTFVLQGAFEVENRLVQARDMLILWNTDSVEMEALSHCGIIVVCEVNRLEQQVVD